ncbi:MAG: DUF4249 domain-containing protein [Marinilabiliaceae bacterium]|nr:DUF4249 domain-containing protein [Marinilabiliaceae bacterium]
MFRQLKFFFLIFILLISCTERIDINTRNAAPRLSVFGYLTNQPGVHTIKITYTAGYFTTEAPIGISNAIVSIFDGDNHYILAENPDTAGVYYTDSLFFAIEGKTYTLDISLDFNRDGTNEQYRATALMPFATRVDSVILSPSQFLPDHPNLLLYGMVPQIQKNYLALYLQKNSEESTIFDYFLILTDSYFESGDSGIINGYEFPCFIRDGIQKGDTISFTVKSFSEDFSTFISHARSEVGGSNPIFGGPPADVRTNIFAIDNNNTTPIVGYFGAFPQDGKSTISDQDFLRH